MKIVMMGATGAVGGEVVRALLKLPKLEKLTLLGRRTIDGLSIEKVSQHVIDVLETESYAQFISGHDAAICTLGVGQPSKLTKDEFLKIDKHAVYDFAKSCKLSGVRHFELLSSVGIDAKSKSFYLRSKGELVEDINGLGFHRFSVFMPSMILTPNNRYGIIQGILLVIWPLLNPLLISGLAKYRGVPVEVLGCAMARNVFTHRSGTEELVWRDFIALAND